MKTKGGGATKKTLSTSFHNTTSFSPLLNWHVGPLQSSFKGGGLLPNAVLRFRRRCLMEFRSGLILRTFQHFAFSPFGRFQEHVWGVVVLLKDHRLRTQIQLSDTGAERRHPQTLGQSSDSVMPFTRVTKGSKKRPRNIFESPPFC